MTPVYDKYETAILLAKAHLAQIHGEEKELDIYAFSYAKIDYNTHTKHYFKFGVWTAEPDPLECLSQGVIEITIPADDQTPKFYITEILKKKELDAVQLPPVETAAL